MVKCIPILIVAAVLIYGGVVDFRKREIPDAVPIILLMTGCFPALNPFERILGLAVPALLLFIAAKLARSEIPGGDFKLLCSLGFACGLRELGAIIFMTSIGALVYGLIKRLPVKRHIPLCSYITPAYIVLQAVTIASSFS